jgi:hypothetical protein
VPHGLSPLVEDLKRVYGLDLDASASHRLVERDSNVESLNEEE